MKVTAAKAPESAVRAVPGAAISNLRDIKPGGGSAGLGALGFLASRRGAPDWSRLFLVSNRHVLFAHGAGPGDPVFQPDFRVAGNGIEFAPDPRPVAFLRDEGFEGNWRYAYPGESEKEWFVDCAAASLCGAGPAPGARGAVLFTSIARPAARDATPAGGLGVYKLGRDREVAGRLVAADATVALEDGTLRHNNLVIRSLPGTDGKVRPFATEGDSGSLIVDRLNRAIGLLWGVSLARKDEAYASHIHPVLDCLKLVPYRRALQPDPGGAEGGRDGAG